jgi:Ran GTPase-activating protein (RanGAP) involved in mRNA processing and transport
MTAKGVNHMCNALFRQQLACARLTRLALAGNSLRAADDTNDITNLLSHCAELEELDLAGTGWTLDKIWSSLKYGGLRLKVLRINGCIMKTSTQAKNASPTSTNLKDFFASAVALRTVSMVECRMSPDSLK